MEYEIEFESIIMKSQCLYNPLPCRSFAVPIYLPMIQRLQTVFLALTILFMIGGIFFPIWVHQGEAGELHKLFPLQLTITGEEGTQVIYYPYCITAVLMIAAATVAIMEIRRYDNRMVQIKLGTLNTLILMCVMLCAVLFSNNLMTEHPGSDHASGLYLNFAAVAANWIALRLIRRDEKLVRDSDKIR